MKLIIQNWGGELHAYVETEQRFKKIEGKVRTTQRVENPQELLGDNCYLDDMENDTHMVFDIKRGK